MDWAPPTHWTTGRQQQSLEGWACFVDGQWLGQCLVALLGSFFYARTPEGSESDGFALHFFLSWECQARQKSPASPSICRPCTRVVSRSNGLFVEGTRVVPASSTTQGVEMKFAEIFFGSLELIGLNPK